MDVHLDGRGNLSDRVGSAEQSAVAADLGRHAAEVRLDQRFRQRPAVALVEPSGAAIGSEHRKPGLVIDRRELGMGEIHQLLAGAGPPPLGSDIQDADGTERRFLAKGADVQDARDSAVIDGNEGLVLRVREDLAPDTGAATQPIWLSRSEAAVGGLGCGCVGRGGIDGVVRYGPPDRDRPQPGARYHGDGSGALDRDLSAASRLDRFPPAWRDQAGRKVGQRRQHEQAALHRWMRDFEEASSRGRNGGGGERRGLRWAVDRQAGVAEDQQVEVELARAPATPGLAAEFALETLQVDEQARCPRRGVNAGGHVQGDDGVQEVGLVDDTDGIGPIEAGDATEARTGQGAERRQGVGQRSARVADVRPEPDVRLNALAHAHLDRSGRGPGYSRQVQPVAVRILHPASSPNAGPLERALEAARAANAERLVGMFRASGASDVRIDSGAPDGRSFGARLRGLIEGLAPNAGLVVLGSGSIPLAVRADGVALVAAAGGGVRRALTNNVYSADVVAIGAAANLASVPDLLSDNALPRWLAESAGYEVAALPRPRLAMDLDSPLDALLVAFVGGTSVSAAPAVAGIDTSLVLDRISRIRAVASDPHRQLVVAGRSSSATLRWLEAATASRTRALIEERGLRAIGVAPAQAPPRSVLGMLLDDRGPAAFGKVLAALGDAAIVDSRVLLAHRLGADEATWPSPEDRFASDLLLADQVRDPWLRALTTSARDAPIPVLLGGHTLVGPGVRLALRGRR